MHQSPSSFRNPQNFPYFAVVITALYFSQGLPGGFIAHALPVYLREEGGSLALIGYLKLLALPWLLKVIWAPYVDRHSDLSGRRRWIVSMQSISIVGLLCLSWLFGLGSESILLWGVIFLLLVNLASSTQDIATDGLTVRYTPKAQLGFANSIQVVGYKLGMIVGGSGLLYCSQFLSMPELIKILAGALALCLIPLLILKEKVRNTASVSSIKAKDHQSAASQTRLEHDSNHDERIEPSQRNGIFRTIWTSYSGLIKSSGFKGWLLVLLTYKVADSLGSTMIKPLMVDVGIAGHEIGEIILQASLIGILGAGIAGLLYKRFGGLSALVIFGILQTLTISGFYFVANGFLDKSAFRLLVMAEQFCDGLSTVALFAMMMDKCRSTHEGADYTFQASIQIVLAGVVGAFSGLIAQAFGYTTLYLLCAIMGFIAVMLVVHYGRLLEKNKKQNAESI